MDSEDIWLHMLEDLDKTVTELNQNLDQLLTMNSNSTFIVDVMSLEIFVAHGYYITEHSILFIC